MWFINKIPPESFPKSLTEIPQPPKQLFLVGNLPDPQKYKYLTIVGSRRFSQYGKEVCERLIEGLTGQPIAIVSGLALGIDSLAHQAAIRAGLPTVAVPGSGLDPKVLYPRSNWRLANQIIKSGGALLSELGPQTKAATYTFPRRNRIMAGLSDATLIVEATEKSGTLITARLAVDYNREVMAVPGSIFQLSCIGSNQLIRSGATPVTCTSDVLEALGLNTGLAPNKSETLLADLATKEEQEIFNILKNEPLSIDDLINKIKIGTDQANVLLSHMEVKGLIKEVGGLFTIT